MRVRVCMYVHGRERERTRRVEREDEDGERKGQAYMSQV